MICKHHEDKGLKPVMVSFGESPLGNQQFVCARCSRIREAGVGRIKSVKNNYGFICNKKKKEFFFHFSNTAYDFDIRVGKPVVFEIAFLDDGVEAINVTELKRKKQ